MLSKYLCVVIPAYNSANTLEKVILDIHKHLQKSTIIVVDDGSSDATTEILKTLEIIDIVHEKNFGKGAALRSGFKKAILFDASLILTVDADGQHNPKNIGKFLAKYEENQFDIIIGSRMWDTSSMPIHRIVSNKITSKLISWRIGQSIPDSQCGFRLIRAEVLKNIKLKSNRFDMESELIIKASQEGFKIGTVDITTIYPKNQTSAMNLIRDSGRFVWLYIQSYFW